MKSIFAVSVAAGVLALAGCNQSPTEQKADAIEQNAEDTADALEEKSDTTSSEAVEEGLENRADEVRDAGAN